MSIFNKLRGTKNDPPVSEVEKEPGIFLSEAQFEILKEAIDLATKREDQINALGDALAKATMRNPIDTVELRQLATNYMEKRITWVNLGHMTAVEMESRFFPNVTGKSK